MLNAQFSYNKKQVCFLTGMDAQQLQNFITATAMDWLEFYYGNIIDCTKLIGCPLFANWWVFHWYTRDDRYVIQQLYRIPNKSCRLFEYRSIHQSVFADTDDGNTMHIDFKSMLKQFYTELNKAKQTA